MTTPQLYKQDFGIQRQDLSHEQVLLLLFAFVFLRHGGVR